MTSQVAVVSFAQAPCRVREDVTTSGVEMLVPIFAEVFGATGLTRADIAFQHLVLGCEPGEVRMGLRVRAVWNDSGGISGFAPNGEPDAAYESYARCF